MIQPVLQATGLQTVQASPINGIHNPVLPPPIPLIPPSLFSPHPSLPDLRNPAFSDWYWAKQKDGLKGDYIRGDHSRGSGYTSILGKSADVEGDRLKKTLYRNDLLSQMDGNRMKRID